ncbi:MAG: histidine phosphatase family protein [Alphaproteobacteria bacterium]|nr:histidine phosphatase family protein [Alphaproteobacteria bacterium]
MAMIKNIFTIRHGEAEHQVNPNIWKTHGNAEIPLTILGRQQANDCGEFIASMDIDWDKTLIVVSPFARAKQTYEQIQRHLPCAMTITESLVEEQDFGLFNGLSTEQCYTTYPRYAKLYDLQAKRDGEFNVVPPNGESKASVVKRAEKFLEKILLNSQDQQIENIIVVSHCVFNRALNKVLMQQTPEWLMAEKQHENCAVKQFIRINHKWSDRGFIFVPQNKSLNNGVAKSLQKQVIGVER